ncbi:FeoA family protein [Chloroflexota bacterium]
MTLFGREIFFCKHRRKRASMIQGADRSLVDVAVGERACVRGFCSSLPAERQAYLQAYGLMPGYRVRILQQHPVTVVQIENMELAMEDNLARRVQVEEL